MEVEADFPPGENLLVRAKRGQAVKGSGVRLPCIVRMHADGCENVVMLFGQADGGFKIGRAVAGPDGEDQADARRLGALENLRAVVVKCRVIEVAVRVGDHLKEAPVGTSSRNPARTGLPPSRLAATIIPFDSTPRILRGLRFATMTTLRPIRDSGS